MAKGEATPRRSSSLPLGSTPSPRKDPATLLLRENYVDDRSKSVDLELAVAGTVESDGLGAPLGNYSTLYILRYSQIHVFVDGACEKKIKSAIEGSVSSPQVKEEEIVGSQLPLLAPKLSPEVLPDSSQTCQSSTLRAYQKELVNAAMSPPENVIILAPIGSGKTLVAAEIIKRHMLGSPPPETFTALFLVNTRQRASKALLHLERELAPWEVAELTGAELTSDQMPQLEDLVKDRRYQVIVVTAQVLVNHLMGKEDFKKMSIGDVDLLIFDECHHTHGKHPYKKIMNFYHETKRLGLKLPKVLGLTSSIRTGDESTLEGTLEELYKLCGSLESLRIVRVKETLHELQKDFPSSEADEADLAKKGLLEDALTKFEKMSTEQRDKKIKRLQQEKEKKKAKKQSRRGHPYDMTQVEFFCKYCSSFLCRGDSIRKLGTVHRISIGEDISNNARWLSRFHVVHSIDGIDIGGSVKCAMSWCNQQIGAVVRRRQDSEFFPALKMREHLLWSYDGSSRLPVTRKETKEFDLVIPYY